MFDVLRRRARRWMSRGRGEIGSFQELRQYRDVVRFGSVFALLILLPAVLLAGIAWDATSAVESSVDLELRLRADAAARQVQVQLDELFDRFETRVAGRLENGETLLADLADLSPHLRAAFRFDASGRLVDPFTARYEEPTPPMTPRQRMLLDAAARAGTPDAWREALAAAGENPQANASARLGLASALLADQQPVSAESELGDLYADYANHRDPRGLRIGEIALLMRAEIRFLRSPDIGASALMDLVDQASTAKWEVGRQDSPAVARRALARLEGYADPEWMARQRSRLNERALELWWASELQEELDLLGRSVGPPDQVQYFSARSGSPALWAQLEHGDIYVFSFAVADIVAEITAQAARINQLDRDLRALVAETGLDTPDGALAEATFGRLPAAKVYVVAADPAALDRLKNSRRTTQGLVVGLAIVLVGMGIAVSARIVGREVETARMKADFAANVSHELRSPITQIRLKAESLQLGLTYDEADNRKHYDAIVTSAEQLSRLVDNVLDFAAIERGVKKYAMRPDDLAEIVWTAIEATGAEIDERGIVLDANISEDLPALWMDRDAIGQVVANLLSNALKYGGTGRWVGVSLRRVGDRVELSVADRGIGIAARDQEQIFEHFFRSQDPAVRRVKGTGIGLTIVRYIVEAHGGMITIESAPGQGSVFTVSLPASPPEPS